MLSVLSRTLLRFQRDERGAALAIFIILLVPILLLSAVGVDLGQAYIVKRQLRGAVDAAALTLGTLPQLNDADAQAKAEAYVRAHYPEKIGILRAVDVVRSDNTITVTATAEVETTFLRFAGYDVLIVKVEAEAVRKENKLEVVMALDNTGSMGANNKILALRSAATTLVDTLMGDNVTSEAVKIGLVPFTSAVNVGANNRGASWLDEAHPSALNFETITQLPTNRSLFSLYSDMAALNPYADWKGCVRARTANNFDENDITPDTSDPNTLFTALLWPNEPSTSYNLFLPSVYITDYRPYSLTPASINYVMGPNGFCPDAAIQPLTNVKATITTAIGNMTASGQTAVPEGLAWGWRVISPTVPFSEGVPYTQDDTIKAIILMTDGQNEVYNFSAYGYPNDHLGYDTTTALNGKLSRICNNIKAIKDANNNDAIQIYTIAFGNPPENIVTLMRQCATEPGNFFNSPTNDDLKTAFESIAIGLNELRVSR
ncbi:MAG: pilus assembly protein TadG-related protein [Alphaproteobacteria bacterium]